MVLVPLRTECVGGDLDLLPQCDEVLSQRVVELPGDPRTFVQDGRVPRPDAPFVPRPDAASARRDEQGTNKYSHEDQDHVEPNGLHETRMENQRHNAAVLAPWSPTIVRHGAKLIVTRREVGVVRHAPRAGLDPPAIIA